MKLIRQKSVEGESSRPRVVGSLELGPVLGYVRPRFEIFPYPESIEDRSVEREQTLTDLKPRKSFSLDHIHRETFLGEQDRGGRSSGSATGDDDIDRPGG